jgi:nucleoside-diphosphate-sugar epimerase
VTWEEANTTTLPVTAYRASKKFAELAVWNFIEEQKPQFDAITILPPMVFGPCQHDVTLATLNESNAQIWKILSGGREGVVPPTLMWQWVDVRDVAEAHVNALDPAVKGNQRFLLGAGDFTWQKVEVLRLKILMCRSWILQKRGYPSRHSPRRSYLLEIPIINYRRKGGGSMSQKRRRN